MKIGIIVDSLAMELEDGIAAAARLGADGIQLYAVQGRAAPWNLTQPARINLKKYIADCGLEVSALCGDFGGHGFQAAEENTVKLERSKQVLALAKDLGSNIVTTHIGIIPKDLSCEIAQVMLAACRQLEQAANEQDGYFAIETGCETAAELKLFLQQLGSKRICVNYDPANLVMVTGDDPIAGVEHLKASIVHTHAKDGIRLQKIDPKIVYGYPGFEAMSHEKISAMVTKGEYFKETKLGAGAVNFPAYLQKLKSTGYNGYLTIEREVKGNPLDDIGEAVAYLKQFDLSLPCPDIHSQTAYSKDTVW